MNMQYIQNGFTTSLMMIDSRYTVFKFECADLEEESAGMDLAKSVEIYCQGVLVAQDAMCDIENINTNNYWIWALQIATKINGMHVSDIATILHHCENFMPMDATRSYQKLDDWIQNELETQDLEQFEGIE